jgi:type I restriction enzyme S subunit
MNSTERVLSHFDQISEAPDAIARLRRFVLDLAVRGKLVDQDPNDEPASELVERIQAEKLAAGIRVSNKLTAPDESDLPFPASDRWAWVQIGRVTSDRGQSIPSQSFTYIDVTSIDKEVGRIADPKVLSAADAPSRARKIAHKGDLLYSCVRPYLLNVAVIDRDFTPAPIASTAFAVLNGFGLVLPRYLWIALRSPMMVAQVESKMRGQAYPAINDSDFKALPFPLPPLAEQQRIVAKVDELMALSVRLEAAQKERESRRDRLVSASLARLNESADAPAFQEHVRFHLDHLPRMTASRGQMQQLRETILNLAVRGLLVRQDPQEATRPDLVEAATSPSVAEQVPRLPIGWQLAALERIADAVVDCPHSTPKWTNEGKLCVRTNQFRPGRLDLAGSRFVSEATYIKRIERLRPVENDILYSREGGILGVACRVPPGIELCLGQRMMLIRSGRRIRPDYLEMVLNSPLITAIAKRHTTGGAAPRINVATVKAFPIPVPPLQEQQRIVAMVRELMAVCDQLEGQIEVGRNAQAELLEATLRAALTSPECPAVIAAG